MSPIRLEATLNDLASFTNEMMNSKVDLTTHILEFKYIPPPNAVSTVLELRDDEMVAMMERVRHVDGKPIAAERWYAPLKYFPGIDRKMFKESGMEQSTYYIMMKQYKVQVTRALDTVSPVGVEPHEAKILEVEPGRPVMLRTRVSYGLDMQPLTYAIGVYLIHLKFMMGSNTPAGYNSNHLPEREITWEKH